MMATEPRGPIVFVATCPVCSAEVWTYRRIGGTAMLGPHRKGKNRKSGPCEGGCQPLEAPK